MLDLYKRECPRCAAPIEGQPLLCPVCHMILPSPLSRTRRIVEDALLGVLLAGLFVAILAPDMVRNLRAPSGPAAQPIAAWRGPGAEPPARAWAARLEPSLDAVCRDTFSRYGDRKFVAVSLAQQLGAVTRAQGLHITPESLQLTPEEEKEALAIVGSEQRFMHECLRWTYAAIRGCEAFKDDLGGYAASDCMVPRVLRSLASAPFALCADEAKSDRVRRACSLASEAAARAAEKR